MVGLKGDRMNPQSSDSESELEMKGDWKRDHRSKSQNACGL
jgi:hypothetical protein